MLLAALFALAVVPTATAARPQEEGEATKFSTEEIDQLLAPIALYPDDLIAQVFMASTYPLEVVEADRFAKANKDLKGDDLAKKLEEQKWDPSVKSLVNFPSVLGQMSEKLDWTQKLGDAFLGQQAEVMEGVQRLRKAANDAGQLKTTAEQKVIVEKEVIVIQPAKPEVIYVPTYNPTVVYGAWPYPAYPPTAYYPPSYAYPAATGFVAGMAVGAAWGYAWGNCNWNNNNCNIDINKNTNINARANGSRPNQGGNWKHNSEHRKGVQYRDKGTASKYGQNNRQGTRQDSAARGRTSTQDAGRRSNTGSGDRGRASSTGAGDRGRASSTGAGDRGRASSTGSGDRGRSSGASSSNRGKSGGGGAFGGSGGSKSQAKSAQSRGSSSLGGSSRGRSSGGRSGGGRSGGGRSGGGGGRR